METVRYDPVAWIEHFTAKKRNAWFFSLFFLFPVVGNVISRLTRGRWWLVDFDAVMCAAHTYARGVSPYSLHPVCDTIRPTPFVYAPQVAAAFGPIDHLFGLTGARWAFALIYIPAMAFLIWYAVLRSMKTVPWQLRLMTLAAMVGSVLSCGNIGLVFHAVAIATALNMRRLRWLFVAIVLLGGLVKPTFLVYLTVLLLEDRTVGARLRDFALASGVSLIALAALFMTAGPLSDDWHAALKAITIVQQPGISLFATTSALGLETGSLPALMIYTAFAAVFGLSALLTAERSGLTAEERIIFALGAAQFLNPRMMDYDMFALAPCMAILVMRARDMGEAPGRWISWAFVATLTACVLCNVFEIRVVHRAPVAVFIYGLMIIAAAGLMLWQRRDQLRQRLRLA